MDLAKREFTGLLRTLNAFLLKRLGAAIVLGESQREIFRGVVPDERIYVVPIEGRTIPRLVECRLFDGSRLPWGSGRFDLAVLSHVVEHLEHPRQLLVEAARVARYVFVEVPTEDITRRPKDYAPDRVGHINFYSPRTIRWLVQSVGLRVLTQATTNPAKAVYMYQAGRRGLIHYHTKDLLLRLAPALATRHFCYHEALLATAQPVDGTGAEPAGRVGSELA